MHDQSFVLDPLIFRTKNKLFEANKSKADLFWNEKIYFLMGNGVILVNRLFMFLQSSNKTNSSSSSKNVFEHHATWMEKLFWKTSMVYNSLTIRQIHTMNIRQLHLSMKDDDIYRGLIKLRLRWFQKGKRKQHKKLRLSTSFLWSPFAHLIDLLNASYPTFSHMVNL